MRLLLALAAVAVTVCGNSQICVAGPISDPIGEPTISSFSGVAPDLVGADAIIESGLVTIEILFAPGTFVSAEVPGRTRADVSMDTDQDPTTGAPGSTLIHDIGTFGTDYFLRVNPSQAELWSIAPFSPVWVGPVTVISNGFQVSVPIIEFGSNDGIFNYKMVSLVEYDGGSTSGILDLMSNPGLPPGTSRVVPEPASFPLITGALTVALGALRRRPSRFRRRWRGRGC